MQAVLLAAMVWFYNDLKIRVADGGNLAGFFTPPYKFLIFPLLGLVFLFGVFKLSLTASAIDKEHEHKTFGRYWWISITVIAVMYLVFRMFIT